MIVLLSIFLFICAAKNGGSKKELGVPTLFSFLTGYAFILRVA